VRFVCGLEVGCVFSGEEGEMSSFAGPCRPYSPCSLRGGYRYIGRNRLC
jgi:hypothetical protein